MDNEFINEKGQYLIKNVYDQKIFFRRGQCIKIIVFLKYITLVKIKFKVCIVLDLVNMLSIKSPSFLLSIKLFHNGSILLLVSHVAFIFLSLWFFVIPSPLH